MRATSGCTWSARSSVQRSEPSPTSSSAGGRRPSLARRRRRARRPATDCPRRWSRRARLVRDNCERITVRVLLGEPAKARDRSVPFSSVGPVTARFVRRSRWTGSRPGEECRRRRGGLWALKGWAARSGRWRGARAAAVTSSAEPVVGGFAGVEVEGSRRPDLPSRRLVVSSRERRRIPRVFPGERLRVGQRLLEVGGADRPAGGHVAEQSTEGWDAPGRGPGPARRRALERHGLSPWSGVGFAEGIARASPRTSSADRLTRMPFPVYVHKIVTVETVRRSGFGFVRVPREEEAALSEVSVCPARLSAAKRWLPRAAPARRAHWGARRSPRSDGGGNPR